MLATTDAPDYPVARQRWAWFLALGLALVLVGALALGFTAVQLVSVLILGPILIVNSILQGILASLTRPGRSRWLHMGSALLSAVLGFLVMAFPADAVTDLALLLAAFLVVAGMQRLLQALVPGWPTCGWMLVAGVLALALAACSCLQGPTWGLGLITLCVALDFVCHGASWTWFSLAGRGTLESPLPPSEELRIEDLKPSPFQKQGT